MVEPGQDRPPPAPPPDLAGQVDVKARRKLAARRHARPGLWFGLGMMGLIGWSIVLPTLLGAALGRWLDSQFPGRQGWTLALLVAGLVLGCAHAWHWIGRQHRAMRRDDGHGDDEHG